MQIFRQLWISDSAGGVQSSIRRFCEKERRLAVGIIAHLAGMGLVIAAHTENAANGKAVSGALNGKAGLRGRIEYVHR